MTVRSDSTAVTEPTTHRILISGASSGLGAALAQLYARRHGPAVTLGLLARRAERLQALAETLNPTGARVLIYPVDVRDREATVATVQAFDGESGGCTLAYASAGISRGDRILKGDPAAAAEVILSNVNGLLHTLMPLIPGMIERRQGHLVGISSVAGFRGLPGKGAYSASKAAVKTLMDAWRPQLRPHGVRATAICPGWFESELTANNAYPMPFMMDTASAARRTVRAVDQGRGTYVFPWQMHLAARLMQVLPERLLPTHATRS